MNSNSESRLTGDSLWASYITYPSQELPPNKRSKISHQPAAVVCCDQPCPDDEVCFQDYCRNYCPDLCTDNYECTDGCHDPCAIQPCPEQIAYQQHAACSGHCHDTFFHNPHNIHNLCNDHCHDPCTQPCDFTAPDFCTLNHCIDPATACMHECPDWCTSHCLTDCLDCSSSPSMSDVHTPAQPSPRTHLLIKPQPPQTPDQPELLLRQASEAFDTPHVCKVKGCTAGGFKNEDALQDHIERNHLVKMDGKYICQWEGCIKKVTKKSNEHMEKEREARAKGLVYVPPPEPFADDHLHKLKRHYYVHSGKKAFECNYPGCGSVHATKAQLKVHMARHNPKEFICEDCDKVFTTQNQLKTHINAVHKKQKHFRCPECDYACDDSSNMSSHKRKQHQLGVPCPGTEDFGCQYRDGRQAEMEKHIRMAKHHAWMLENEKKDFESYWKDEKRNVENEKGDESPVDSHIVEDYTPPKKTNARRQRKVAHRRKQSCSTNVSETSRPSSSLEHIETPGHGFEAATDILARHANVGRF